MLNCYIFVLSRKKNPIENMCSYDKVWPIEMTRISPDLALLTFYCYFPMLSLLRIDFVVFCHSL